MMNWRMLSGRKPGMLTRGGTILAVLVTLELATRLFRPDQMQRTIFDPDLGYKLRPHVHELTTDRESGETLTLITNSHGFRGAEWQIPKPAGVRRIAVLGNSFVEAQGYDDARTFCGLLNQHLNDASSASNETWEVMNFGISGYSTSCELALYRKTVRQFEPDLVLLCSSITMDVCGNSRELAQSHKRVFPEIDAAGAITLIPPPRDHDSNLRYSSKLYVWQKNRMQQLVDAIRSLNIVDDVVNPTEKLWQSKLDNALALSVQPLDESYVRSWQITEQLIRQLRDEVTADGAEFLLLNLPDAWQVYPARLETYRAQTAPQQTFDSAQAEHQLAEIATRLNLTSIDLAEAFRAEAAEQTQPDALFLREAGHFTALGHELVARETLRFLRNHARVFAPVHDQIATENHRAVIR